MTTSATNEVCGNPECRKECSAKKICSKCRSTPYCSRDCQAVHWPRHKKICGLLNPGEAQQLNHRDHNRDLIPDELYPQLISALSSFPQPCRDIYRLFMETPKEEEQARLNRRVKQMKKLARRIPSGAREVMTFHMVQLLIREKTWRIEKPTSPLLILFQAGVNADALSTNTRTGRPDEASYTCLCQIAQMSSTHERYNRNQLILGRQFIEVGGADVNAKANPGILSCFPLFNACDSRVCLNLPFVRLLLENGADPNQQNARGETPLMNALDCSIPAAKLLLTFEHENACPVNVNVRAFDGRTVLGMVNESFGNMTRGLAHHFHLALTGERQHSLDKVEYLLFQVVELRSLLLERGAIAGEPIETELPVITAKIQEAGEEGWKDRGLFATPLDYDVCCLFGKDLQRDANAPQWQKDIWIDDLESIQFEVHERKDHLHSNRSRGGGRSPEVGLRIKLEVRLPNKSKGILDGKLVEVLPAPTDADMRRNQSSLLGTKCPCNDPECKRTKMGKRKDIVAKHGALHGQEVKGVVKLAKSMRGDKSLAAFFRADTKYDIILRCKDNFPNMWFLARIGPHQSRSS